jgi:hypothetical protein
MFVRKCVQQLAHKASECEPLSTTTTTMMSGSAQPGQWQSSTALGGSACVSVDARNAVEAQCGQNGDENLNLRD